MAKKAKTAGRGNGIREANCFNAAESQDFDYRLRELEGWVAQTKKDLELDAELTRPPVKLKADDLKGRLTFLEDEMSSIRTQLENEHRVAMSPESAARRHGTKSGFYKLARQYEGFRKKDTERKRQAAAKQGRQIEF